MGDDVTFLCQLLRTSRSRGLKKREPTAEPTDTDPNPETLVCGSVSIIPRNGFTLDVLPASITNRCVWFNPAHISQN